jgi:hypothetical protein
MIPFAQHADKVQQHIEEAYGIRVVTRDVPDPLTGDLNGAEIHIDYAVSAEERLFLLAHLFGHTVQWNVSQAAFDLGQPRVPPVDLECLPALMEYEREAARYALGVLHESGVLDADQWFADFAACDECYLRHFYVTGEKQPFLSFWRDGVPGLDAKEVPRFVPAVKTFRRDGIVI